MKKILFYSLAAAMALPVLTGCDEDHNFATVGEGQLVLSATFSNDVKVASRATAEELAAEYGESALIWISSEKGLVREYTGIANLPADGIKLAGGNYVAEVWAGDSVSASFDKKYFKGRAPFTINSGVTRVDVNCRIANVVVSVAYSNEVDQALRDYTLTVEHHRGSLTFEGRDSRKGYFMMPTGYTDFTWTLNGTLEDGSKFTKTGDILDVKPTTEYAINVRYSHKDESLGGAFIEIVIDESTIDSSEDLTISTPPMIQGVNFTLSDGVMGNKGALGRASLYITAATQLKEVLIESSALQSVISENDVDIIGAHASVISALNAGGITWERNYDSTADLDALKLNFGASFTSSLDLGDYNVDVTAIDKFGKSTKVSFLIRVMEAKVETLVVNNDDITKHSVVLRGQKMKDDATGLGFDYRTADNSRAAGEWIHVDADNIEGNTFTATVTGLRSGTTYEYRTVCDDYVSQTIKSFTTEAYPQLPNAGFEDWQTSSSPYLIYAAGGNMFWDSGNHGSATMKKNVTTPSSDVKHSGNFSACLQSQFVGVGSIGKFAAGNIFIGQYLKTDGTDGVLGFGRPFTYSPVALRGYVQYTPGEVKYEDSDYPDLKKGDMDHGVIYIALLDGTTDPEYPEFPVVIKTKTKQLFNANGSNIIAYGYLEFDRATNGMVEFNIPLEYRRPGVTPSFIMCTAAASKGGDYFVGGKSVMYLDDLELVYAD